MIEITNSGTCKIGNVEHNNELELEAVHRWIKWTFNYSTPSEWIDAIWGGTNLHEHISKKWQRYNGDMNRFYCELDKENETKLVKYVLENYNP